jgi:hypothetical protein
MKAILFFFALALTAVEASADNNIDRVFGDWYVTTVMSSSGQVMVTAINPATVKEGGTKFVIFSNANDCNRFTTQLSVPNTDTEDYTDPDFGFIRVLIDDEPIIGTPIEYVYKAGDDVAFMRMLVGNAPPKQGEKLWDYLSNHRVMRTEVYTMTGGKYSEFFDIRQGKDAMDWMTSVCEGYSGKAL